MNKHIEAVEPEPPWLQAMRQAAVQRPRTQFVKVRWALLQPLLRERDALWAAATPETRQTIRAMRQADNYAYERPRTLHPHDGPIGGGAQELIPKGAERSARGALEPSAHPPRTCVTSPRVD